MKAAYYDQLGPAVEVLKVGDVPTPAPGPGEVRVKVAMSGVNPSDIKGRSGFKGAMPFKRIIPHQDGAGVIDSVGQGICESRIGERVWMFEAQSGRAFGTAAEFVVLPAGNVVRLADDVSFETGASLGIAALTAHYCLFADGELTGKRVLVQGGSGVVGEAAIQLAKWTGAWVATTIRHARDVETAKASGADLIINMREEDVSAAIKAATHGKGVDRIIEVDPIANLKIDMDCLARGGTISVYAVTTPDAELSIPVMKSMGNCSVLRFVLVYNIPDEAKRRAIGDVTSCIAQGAYKPTIGLTVPLEQIAQAHEALETRAVKGKVLIDVQP
ncbi:NADPH:quinone reductase [Pseudomonas fluorescens]|uniref:Alcohol dehydrogenase n=1 Tax=Pseudomonas fluorescens TaxID=294 RepID=A0A5E7SQT0_PSEFL|nr:NADPH:quinone reductase [Pseudomonas fluorescens]VVP88295.1 Alcohol dehydrogenase [Pseudomonas fluorescens]